LVVVFAVVAGYCKYLKVLLTEVLFWGAWKPFQEPIVTITIMATDNGSRGLNGPCVRKQDASDAIHEEKPDIVICSWMVKSSDFFSWYSE
jgi:hypothetical protein